MNGKHQPNSIMESFIMASGKMEKEMVGVNKSGKMEHFIRGIGKMIWQMEKAD